MTDVILDAPRPATGADAETTLTDRNAQLARFIVTNFSDLTAVAYETHPNLLVFDADKIIGDLTGRLNRYSGPALETPFIKWAKRLVIHEARRYQITAAILSEQKRVIHSAIKEHLWTSSVDLAIEEQDVYWEIALLVWQRAHSLNRRGKAKLSTRLTALVKKHCYLYHNARNERRHKAVQRRVEAGRPICCEQLPEQELAAIENNSDCERMVA